MEGQKAKGRERLAPSSGKASRPKKIVKGGTASARKHRFESFNQRIAKLNIDPVRRRRRDEIQEEHLGESASFFRTSLDRWKDLNLSESFSNFVGEVDKLCNTLPQILHYEDRIFSALVAYIDKRDTLALEPLLDLLSNFAHDLGVRFEGYYERAVTLVASVAAKHTDPEAIEWSFTCLAWLFKYLSRLLVPDLRPTFRIMAGLLGREPQKIHTTRFAAEAMSFLLRKAALMYSKDEKPLRVILEAIREDVSSLAKYETGADLVDLYKSGLSMLLLNSLKGIERKLHSCSGYIYRCVLDLVYTDSQRNTAFEDILCGVTVALVHHTDAAGFQPLLDIILQDLDTLSPGSSSQMIRMCARLLFIVSAVRQGSRVQDWNPVLEGTLKLLACCGMQDQNMVTGIYRTVAVTFQSSPLDAVIPRFRKAMRTIEKVEFERFFLPFCNYFYDLGPERFQNLLLPYFRNFIVTHWQSHELDLCLTIARLDYADGQNLLTCPESWQGAIKERFKHAVVRDDLILHCFGYLGFIEVAPTSPTTISSIQRDLKRIVCAALQSSSNQDMRTSFGLGAGLKAYVKSAEVADEELLELWPLLCAEAPKFGNMLPYLEAMLELLHRIDCKEITGDTDSIINILIDNLHSASKALRKVSLSILYVLCQKQNQESAEILSTALEIESSPLDLSSTRSISMQIRRLSSSYPTIAGHRWLPKAIAHFYFGLLSYKLSSTNNDAIVALKQLCEFKVGEDIVSELCFSWLEQHQSNLADDDVSENGRPAQGGRLTDFQCSNLIRVEDMINRDSKQIAEAPKIMQQEFDDAHKRHSQQVPGARSLALRVLAEVPHIVEKRSRRFVPLFLSWAQDRDAGEANDTIDGQVDGDASRASSTHDDMLHIYGLRDRKAMLALFCRFNNPTVLYRSSEVYEALQNLLTSGDGEIQGSALKGISTWKMKELQPYHEHLSNLLDDKRFREEISTFLQVDDQDSVIEAEHRPVLMPVMLRLLYGRIIARGGSSQIVRRKAVLQALSRLNDEYLHIFINIALGPLRALEILDMHDGPPKAQRATLLCSKVNEQVIAQELLSTRRQAGLVTMMKDMLSILGNKLAVFTPSLISALLYCMVRANRQMQMADKDSAAGGSESQQTSLLRSIRHSGLQCVVMLFKCCSFQQLESYVDIILEETLGARLDNLAIETAQAVSGTLQLISTLASGPETVSILRDFEAGRRILPAVVKCLEVPSAKDEVKLFVIDDILKKVVDLARSASHKGSEADNGLTARQVLRPAMDLILEHVGALLRRSPGKDLLASTIELVSLLSTLVEGSPQSQSLLEISVFLLNQPSQRVSPKSKGNLLQTIKHFLPLVGPDLSESILHNIYHTTSSLFGYFKDRANRITLSEVMTVLASRDESLESVAKLCGALNTFSTKRLDEPDFDLRMKAFGVINEDQFRSFTSRQWRPLLYNMLYYIKDNEELAIRTNASFALRRFVETNVLKPEDSTSESFHLVKSILLPALRSGVSQSSEIVRVEYLGVTAHLVKLNPHWDEVNDMKPLLVEADDEASFFGNILHIQQHRRLRALRRLAAEAHQGTLRSINVAHFFFPLIEHFVFDKADDENAHNLSAEAVKTLGTLASSLEWTQFRAMFRRYSTYIQSKPDLEKTVIRLLGTVIDALAEACQVKGTEDSPVANVDVDVQCNMADKAVRINLAMTVPVQEKLAEDLIHNLLPSLTKYLHEKDESTVSLRVPVAISIVKLLKLLPPEKFRERLPAVLTDVCHILRSRAQESRDLTRKTLAEISTLIGPGYFGFVLKELRSALARGYQLHVLSFTVHSILVATADIFKPGDLDYCLNHIVAVIMDDIFGPTGQEKDAEEYISKMKEVKSSKSYDSMELVAKTTSVESLVHLIRPLQVMLEEKLDLRLVKKIDELLRRIGVGLLRNGCIGDQRILIFCHEIVTEVYKTNGVVMETSQKEANRLKRYLVQPGAKKANTRGSTSSHGYKLARFALDILRTVLRKHDALQTPSNLAGFMPIIGDALIQSDEEVQISALRLLTTIVKVPLKSIDDNGAIYIAECVKVVRSSTSTNAERAQAAVKLVSVILRERRTVDIRESDLAYLLKRLAPDLDQPDKQGVTFNFLRATMARKIVITELYEVMDAVAVMMVTNQTKSARDMARGAYFQFIMEYPQSKERFSKQMSFLVKNLDYKHQEGRQSVLEAIHLLFAKVAGELAQQVLSTFFVPLVMVIVNDESNQCREMAGALLKMSFTRADTERTQSFLSLLRNWINQRDQPLQVRVALQTYGIYLEVKDADAEGEIPVLQTRLAQILKANLKDPETADWEVLFFTLQTFAKICTVSPTYAFAATASPLWATVRQCLAFPHAWVKLSSAKLLGSYFADFARTNVQNEKTVLPLKGSGGHLLSEQEIVDVTRASLALLKVPAVSEELAAQSVRNLVFLGKIMAQTSMPWPQYRARSQCLVGETLRSADDSDPQDDEDDEAEGDNKNMGNLTAHQPTKPGLTHLLATASRILLQPPSINRASALTPHHSILTLLATLLAHLPLPSFNPTLPTILRPLHNLTDASISTPFSTDPAFTESYKSLRTKATETMDLLAQRLGTTQYATLMQTVRDEVRGRREERRGKRRVELVAEPERAGEKRRRKGERKKEGRKRRGEEMGRRRRGL